MVFLAVAVATALLYACWVVWVSLLPVNLYLPLLDLGKITGYRWPSAILYLLIVLTLYGLYALGYWSIRRARTFRTGWIFAAGAVFCVELIWAYPATAADVFGYIAHGRLFWLHQSNPFIIAPDAFPNDAIIPFLAYPDEPSQYGPLWVLLGGAFAGLARGDLLTEVLLYKAVAALAHLGGGALIYAIARRLSGCATLASASAYLYVWNPLLLWEMVGNAHNDGVMMFFGLGAVWLFVAGYDRLVLPALTAGGLVKVPVVLLAPTLLIGLWRRSGPRAVESALLGLVLAIAVYRPFWEGPETLTALRRTDLFTASLGGVLRLALVPTLGVADASSVARTFSLSAFAVVAVLSLVLAIRAEESDAQVLRPAYLTVLAGLLLATTWFQAWYVVWPLALGAALAEPRRHLEVALLSLGGLLQYFVFIYLWVMGLFPPSENLGVQSAAYLAIVGPLMVGVAVTFIRGNRSRAARAHRRIALRR
jgi:alpha-1,6-mannosyltransferase